MTDYSKPVQWHNGERHCIGRVAIVRYSPTTTGHCFYDETSKLIRHHHTGELEFVLESLLSNYPSEQIEEPGK